MNTNCTRFQDLRVSRTMRLPLMTLLLAAFAAVSSSGGNLITNSQFATATGFSPDLDFEGSSDLSNWSTIGSSTSALDCVVNPSTSVGSNGLCGSFAFSPTLALYNPPTSTPTKGNYVLIDADSADEVALQQKLTGLTVGTTYQVRFYQAAGEQTGFGTAGNNASVQWQVCFETTAAAACNQANTPGTNVKDSAVMTFPENDGLLSATSWQVQTVTFKATAATQYLSFFALGPSGAPPMALLTDVEMTALPEPGTLAMFGMGAAMFLGAYRVRRVRK